MTDLGDHDAAISAFTMAGMRTPGADGPGAGNAAAFGRPPHATREMPTRAKLQELLGAWPLPVNGRVDAYRHEK